MRLIIFSIFITITCVGCNQLTDSQLQLRHQGIIDACYTSLEYNQQQKIKTYLESKVINNQITNEQKQIIEKCIKRTVDSKRWSK